MSRPEPARTLNVQTIPSELREFHQWVCWRYETRNNKRNKPPIQARKDVYAKCDDPSTWSTFNGALGAVSQRSNLTGIGFVIANDDPYSGIDIDHCRDAQTRTIQPWAQRIIERLNSYTEVSPSGTGVKIWLRAKLSRDRLLHRNRRDYESGHIEVYSRERYFTVTSQHLDGTPLGIESRQFELEAFHRELFSETSRGNGNHNGNGSRSASLSDRELIDKAIAAKNGAKFTSLWNGDISGYASQSEADIALCSHLAFWTGKDSARIDALFRQSGLMREKWERTDYRQRTIDAAIERTHDAYTPPLHHSNGNGNGSRSTVTEEQAPANDKADEFAFIEPATQFLSVIDPPLRYLIDELVPAGVMVLDHGWPRSLKSWAALEKAIAMATGTPAFGMDRFRVETPIPVLYLSQEDAAPIVRMRVKAMLRARRIESFPETLSFSVFKGVDLDTTEWQDLLCRAIRHKQIKEMTFDPMRRFTSEADRGPREVTRITQYLRTRIINEAGAGCDIVHHDTKPAADGKDDRPRGHRASGGDWFAACECPISFERISDSTSLVVPEAYKLSRDPQSFQIRLETDNEQHPTIARLIGETVSADDAEALTIDNTVLHYISDHTDKSTSAIATGVRRQKAAVFESINRLEKMGKIDSRKDGNADRWHVRKGN